VTDAAPAAPIDNCVSLRADGCPGGVPIPQGRPTRRMPRRCSWRGRGRAPARGSADRSPWRRLRGPGAHASVRSGWARRTATDHALDRLLDSPRSPHRPTQEVYAARCSTRDLRTGDVVRVGTLGPPGGGDQTPSACHLRILASTCKRFRKQSVTIEATMARDDIGASPWDGPFGPGAFQEEAGGSDEDAGAVEVPDAVAAASNGVTSSTGPSTPVTVTGAPTRRRWSSSTRARHRASST
jgi:hypothetical protein